MNRGRLFLGLILFAALLAGGVTLGSVAVYQRAAAVRGWVDPTQEGDLPVRLPLAGVNVELTQYDEPTLNRELDRIAAAGFVWVRQPFLWAEIEPEPGRFDFSRYDPIVEAAAARPSLRLVAVLDSAPQWARRREASAADGLFAPPASMAAFGEFAGIFAARYGDRIDYYQIWDEPNLTLHWGGLDPRPADYAAMLKAAYPAIKRHDPAGTVITAGLAPTVEAGPRNLSDVLYLQALYEAGAADSFDAVAGKPYGFDSSPDDRTVSESVLNFSRIILLREEMVRRGDSHKALWGSHFGWNHLPEGWAGPPSIWGQVDAETQRRYTREAYQRAAREWPWMGGLILQHWAPAAPADDPIQGFAVSEAAAAWFEDGAFFAQPALGVGLHHPVDPRIAYAGEWRFGPLGVDVQHTRGADPPADGSAHVLRFAFEGETLGFKVRRDNYVAYLYIRIDDEPANALPRTAGGEAYLILKSPTLAPQTEVITAARGLGPGPHTAEVRAYLGYERWLLAGVAVGAPPDTAPFDLLLVGGGAAALLGLIGMALLAPQIPRQAVTGNAQALGAYLRRMAGILGALAVSALALVNLALTLNDFLPGMLRRDPAALAATLIATGALAFSPALPVTALALLALWLIIYNRPVIGLALISFWAPFFLVPVELYVWALPMVEICLLLTASAVIVRRIVARRREPDRGHTGWLLADYAMLAFVVAATISLAWAEQINPATREWRIIVIEPAIFYALLRAARLERADLVRLVDVFILAGAIVAVVGLVQFVTGGPGVAIAEQGARRVMSVYTSPNNLALFLGRCIPFGFALALAAPGARRRLVAAGMTLLMLAALVLTQSIGAGLFGVPAALAVILLLWDRRRGAILVSVMALGLLALLPLSRFIPRLQGALELGRASSLVRTQLWTSTLNLLRERPLTGVGLDQFLYAYRSRYILPEAWQEPDLSHPHNIVLDYWSRLGILGVAVLAALQWAFWRGGWRAWRHWQKSDKLLLAVTIGALGSMADFLAHGLVDNSYFVVDLAYVFCFTLALVARLGLGAATDR